jgi:hypothetical protein
MRKLLFVTLCLAAAACSKEQSTGTSTSAISGALALKTFPKDATLVAATNEKGTSTSTAPDAKGAFKLVLAKGHTYKLSVIFADGSEPIVFPRSSGALDQSFKVSSGAALVNLGVVRHLDAAPQGGFSVKSLSTGGGATSSDGDGECENGVDATTGAACIDDQGDVSCQADDANEQDNHADGECENGVDSTTGAACTDPPEADDQADGECENGADVKTGAACTDPEEASPYAPMAVAEHNVPEEVGGCDDSGEESDD